MYPPPDGQDLTEEQAMELDDTFLASDPFEYFNSRIASLLAWHESAPVSDAPLPEPEPGSIRADLNQYSGPRVNGHRQGLEITQLRLKPSALLADAYMLAMAHGALFHVAAVEHFDGRDDFREYQVPPPSPGYLVGGPRPKDIDAHAPLGMRFPLTTPPGGGQVRREAGIGFRDRFQILHIDHANRSSGRVVDG